jgi:hypothetical protein
MRCNAAHQLEEGLLERVNRNSLSYAKFHACPASDPDLVTLVVTLLARELVLLRKVQLRFQLVPPVICSKNVNIIIRRREHRALAVA